jgi:hypothetical protein
MTDTTTGTQPTPPAAGAPSVPDPANPPAATNPASPPSPAGQPAPPADPPKPADPAVKTLTLTQTELDAMIGDRLKRDREAQRKQFAAAFGIPDPASDDGKPSSDDVLAQAQRIAEQAQQRANAATARSFIQSAQIKADRVDTLAGMLDLDTVLKDVDQSNLAAVDAAIKAAVDAKVTEFPEWKATAVPSASTANPNGAPGIPNIDERIAAAPEGGDHRLAISLKRAKAAQQSG